MKSSHAVTALENAARARYPAGTVADSDKGAEFRSRRFVDATGTRATPVLWARSVRARTTPGWNRSPHRCKRNVPDRQRWLTRQDLREAITTWIERTYHRGRRQGPLGKLTSIDQETTESTRAGPVPILYWVFPAWKLICHGCALGQLFARCPPVNRGD
jgi:putative transposase